MASGGERRYRMSRVPRVVQQIEDLANRATERGIRQAFFTALEVALSHLETRPLDWGDPEWRTVAPGGCVCHGCEPPLLVRYVVFEIQREVCLLDVKAISGSSLD
jgi:hypothetical protein